MDHEAAVETTRTATHGPGDPSPCVAHTPSLEDVGIAAHIHGIDAFFEPIRARIMLRKSFRDGRFAAAYIQSERPIYRSETHQIQRDIKNFADSCELIERREG